MESRLDYNKVLEELAQGNKRFLEGKSVKCIHSSLQKMKTYADTGQIPKAIVLSCSDSRAPAEIIFDQDIGDLFVIRVAGNVIAPSLVGSVEFAASMFGTSLIIVMGHTKCGAVEATLEYINNPKILASENIHDIVYRIKPHIHHICNINTLNEDEKLNLAIRVNIEASVNQLSHSSSIIEQLVLDKKIKIIGALLDLSSGQVQFLA